MPAAETRDYWESRLSEEFSLAGVGYLGLGDSFNEWMYRVRRASFLRRLRPLVAARPGLEVLDVGSGTGFYVGLWRELGVSSVTGSDLTETAVGRLAQRYPDCEFVRYELGGEGSALEGRSFDAISAFDVLFHIIDDEVYNRALAGLAGLLRPGGHLVLTDNFLHGPTARASTQVSRSLAETERAVAAAGLEVVSRRPSLVLMNAPIDSDSRALKVWWELLAGAARRSDRLGWALGAALYPLERVLVERLRESPTTEMMVCRKPEVSSG